MNELGFDEVWTGDAVNQLLRGLGINPGTVRYRVASDHWNADSTRREVRAIFDVAIVPTNDESAPSRS